ncbi:MAG: hypothetical protein M1816_000008 [Peltula sp. TS41687]|nr:MAG: hypothetical protein M1816_000008 [Peltula sp. TS41687]
MDITLLFVQLLKKHNISSIGGRSSPSRNADDFPKEAARISSHITSLRRYLRSIRQPYLSTTQPLKRTELSRSGTHFANASRQYFTDAQRDQIDAESKQLLRDMNMAIQNLANAEQLRQKAEATLAQRRRGGVGFSILKGWAAGGSVAGSARTPLEEMEDTRVNTIKLHRESVLWYLRRQLEACSELQMTMMETRLVREMEKGKSRLYSARGMGLPPQTSAIHLDHASVGRKEDNPSSKNGVSDRPSSFDPEHSGFPITSEQLQLFAEENQSMLKHYEDTLDQVRTAERSLIDISELQTTLANNLAVQSAHIDQLVADTQYTSENVGGGNKQLRKASERKSVAKYVFYGSCAFSFFLIVVYLQSPMGAESNRYQLEVSIAPTRPM